MAAQKIARLVSKIVLSAKRAIAHWNGSTVIYDLKAYQQTVVAIRQTERRYLQKSPQELTKISREIKAKAIAENSIHSLVIEAYALVSVVISRTLELNVHDEQLIAALVLHEGKLAEMQTGEGKTLVAVFAAYLNSLTGLGVCVLTFNDYLAKRDADWMSVVYDNLGVSVAYIQEGMPKELREQAYGKDVVYMTAKEYGFDYLRDGFCYSVNDQVRRDFCYTIVDEADSILIDEARIPLVIAGTDLDQAKRIVTARQLIQPLQRIVHFELDEYSRNISLTEQGVSQIERALGIPNLYDDIHVELLTAIGYALHAEHLLTRGVDYLVENGEIVLIDNFTGRVADKRRWSDGLHTAVEEKENVISRCAGGILNSISLQHLLRQLPKISGMSGTCESSAEEFYELYGLKTVIIPTHQPCIRRHHPDRIFVDRDAKFAAVADEIQKTHDSGRPILVGTSSVNESKLLATMLSNRGLTVAVLNAENNEEEAKIVADAGRLGAITISTNMAGRGTDIKLGGCDAFEYERVKFLGGLYVIGTQRNESPRIDRQLCGRAGRQGDPGDSVFFTSLTDPLLEQFNFKSLLPNRFYEELQRLDTGEIDLPLLQKRSNQIQRIIDGQNHQIRRTLTQYSHLLEQQRLIMSFRRQEILDGRDNAEVFISRAGSQFSTLSGQTGEKVLEEACAKILLWCLDKHWQLHVGSTADLQQAVRLRTLGGETPFIEYQKQLTRWFSDFFDAVEDEAIEVFSAIEYRNGRFNLDEMGISSPSATWTYEVNDSLFDDLRDRLLTQPGIASVGAGLLGPLMLLGLWFTKLLRRH